MAMVDCSDCCYMETNPNKDGKFRCTNSKSPYYGTYVNAYMRACKNCLESGFTRRGEYDRKHLRDISRGR